MTSWELRYLVNPGDTAIYAHGVYGPQVLRTDDVTYIGRPGAVIDANGAARIAVLIQGDDIVFKGFEVRDGALSGIRAEGVRIAIEDVTIHDFDGTGASLAGDYFEFRDSEVYDTARHASASAVSLRLKPIADDRPGYHSEVTGTYIHDNRHETGRMTDTNGIIVDGYPDTGYNHVTLIQHNRIERNGGDGILSYNERVAILDNRLKHNALDSHGPHAAEIELRGSGGLVARNDLWAAEGNEAIALTGQRNTATWRSNRSQVDGEPGAHGIAASSAPHLMPAPRLNDFGAVWQNAPSGADDTPGVQAAPLHFDNL